MKCEECIYWKRCQAEMLDEEDEEWQNAHCTIGEPKADYIKLPVKVEDTVYVVFDGELQRATVESISYAEGSWDIELCYENGRTCLHTEEEIGKTIFKTREEAEKK